MAEHIYSIGDVSRITGLSKDTLRYYDKINLLKPGYIDASNHYRYYTYDQFWQIDIIICCRKLNIPIQKIREILQSKDNDEVVNLMKEHQKEALYLSDYYKRVAEDIDWYAKKSKQIQNIEKGTGVTVKYFPKKSVICGKTTEDAKEYHLHLQESCRNATKYSDTFRRNYGYILDAKSIEKNIFKKKREYIEFDNMEEIIDPEYLLELPEGLYVSCIVQLEKGRADFSLLNEWLKENKIDPEYVIAEEIGLQLFDYLEHKHPCEVRVLVKK